VTWAGLTATGLKAAAAQAAQNAFDQHQAAALEKQRPVEIDYNAPPPVKHGDGLTSHFDGGSFGRGPCRCNWRRDGVLGLAKKADGSVIETQVCPSCGKALYQ
jgi:hypothetical protein